VSTPRLRGPRSFAGSPGAAASSIESQYQRKTPVEHVLLRPGMYVGSVEPRAGEMWLPAGDGSLAKQEVEYIPALCKLFDEVLVNAADNKQRDKGMDALDVVIRDGDGALQAPVISVTNNGRGIPVMLHKTEKMYVPELVMGNLLTGSNFDDGEVGGGRRAAGGLRARAHVRTLHTCAHPHARCGAETCARARRCRDD
jgi:DNA topoisomerase-2